MEGVAQTVLPRLQKPRLSTVRGPCSSIFAAADFQCVKQLSPKHSMTWRNRATIASLSKLPVPPSSFSQVFKQTRTAVSRLFGGSVISIAVASSPAAEARPKRAIARCFADEYRVT
jgi:hypothetical protein